MKKYTFTSESVSEGHPDKVADLISDAIADYIIDRNKNHRSAIETMVTTIKYLFLVNIKVQKILMIQL